MYVATTLSDDRPEFMSGYVVEVRYRYIDGRAVPFDPEDDEFDLRFRTWFANGFATRKSGAEELDEAHRVRGWLSRIVRGVAERNGRGGYDFHVLQ